jgi:hypothetical protein
MLSMKKQAGPFTAPPAEVDRPINGAAKGDFRALVESYPQAQPRRQPSHFTVRSIRPSH